MPVDSSETGGDTAVRGPVQAFAATFRDALIKRTTDLLSDQAEELFAGIALELKAQVAACDAGMARLKSLTEEVAGAKPERIRVLVEEYYATAYDLFLQSRSALAFYRLSEEFLRAVSAAIVSSCVPDPGQATGKQAELALIALGPSGRHEFSPFCRLQLLLVHTETDPVLAEALGRRVHGAFESIGLRPDKLITPRNPEWRGTPEQWQTRLSNGLHGGDAKELIQLLRLADQAVLHDNVGMGSEFRRECFGHLRGSRVAVQNLVERVCGLGSGLALMGGVRLVHGGPHAGLFRLLDHALLPLSASVAALSLMQGTETGETLLRIGALNDAGWLDADVAGQLRDAWQLFNELRLVIESREQPHWLSHDLLYLSMPSCSDDEQLSLLKYLKTLDQLQIHLGNSFKRWEEQLPC